MWNSQVKIKAEMINEGASRYVFNKKTDWDVQNKHTKENTLCEFSFVINNEPETLAQIGRAHV